MILNSKWSYIVCGINFMLAVLGAVFHKVFLLSMGIVFMVINYYAAEINRRIEDESIRKSTTETKA